MKYGQSGHSVQICPRNKSVALARMLASAKADGKPFSIRNDLDTPIRMANRVRVRHAERDEAVVCKKSRGFKRLRC